ncbi:hypothetical protein PFISCL1PPCAC_803, partial [Pristionchus fissidentatus]
EALNILRVDGSIRRADDRSWQLPAERGHTLRKRERALRVSLPQWRRPIDARPEYYKCALLICHPLSNESRLVYR